jgi:hypothetical protein
LKAARLLVFNPKSREKKKNKKKKGDLFWRFQILQTGEKNRGGRRMENEHVREPHKGELDRRSAFSRMLWMRRWGSTTERRFERERWERRRKRNLGEIEENSDKGRMEWVGRNSLIVCQDGEGVRGVVRDCSRGLASTFTHDRRCVIEILRGIGENDQLELFLSLS